MLVNQDFINGMEKILKEGVKEGREPDDWKLRDDDGVRDRFAAITRHKCGYLYEKDPDHLLAMACNIMIVWWHEVMKPFEGSS